MVLQHIETGMIIETHNVDLNLKLVKIGEVHHRLSEFVEIESKKKDLK